MALGINIGGFGSTSAAFPGTAGTNAGVPQGPRTAAAAGFGTTVGDGGMDVRTSATLSVGTLALAALVYIWWSLPR